ncbi:MAG: hypothetical protein GW911_02390, partial [Armatimonadetes bacterium]|nr:hypothetical protein [Armatimonadota bacterium]
MSTPLLSHEERWFASRLALSLKAGVPLLQALSLLQEEATEVNPALGAEVSAVRRRFEAGQPLKVALAESTRLSAPLLCVLCYAGEVSGR